MSWQSRVGAACLVTAPIAGLVSALIVHTVSGKAVDQAVAYTEHPGATQLGLAINAIATTLLIAGLIWLAWTTYERSPRLATVGGVLGVLGMLAALVDDAVHLSGSAIVGGMTTTQAASLLHPLVSGGVFAVGPLSELADVGVILLAVAALRLGVAGWAAAVLIVGVIAEGVGFAAGTRYLVAAGFALAFVGFAMIVHTTLAKASAASPSMSAVAQHT